MMCRGSKQKYDGANACGGGVIVCKDRARDRPKLLT